MILNQIISYTKPKKRGNFIETLNLLYAKYFCDAVLAESVAAAAKVNFVTPSAISQGIAKLEQSLKCELLFHHPNRLRLTPAGELAFQELCVILKRANEFQNHFPSNSADFLGDLVFACSFTLSSAFIPPYLKKFHNAYPQVKLQLHTTGNLEEVRKMIKSNAVDFAIFPKGPFSEPPGFEKTNIYEVISHLYVSRDVAIKDEKKLKFIVPEENLGVNFEELYFQKYRKAPDILLRSSVPVVIANLVKQGLGIGVLPDYIGKIDRSFRLSSIQIKIPPASIHALFLSDMKLRKSSKTFLSYFKNRKL